MALRTVGLDRPNSSTSLDPLAIGRLTFQSPRSMRARMVPASCRHGGLRGLGALDGVRALDAAKQLLGLLVVLRP